MSEQEPDDNKRKRKPKPKAPPRFTKPDFFMHQGPKSAEYWIARALLIGEYRDEPERLQMMLEATDYCDVIDITGWLALAEDYPQSSLPEGDRTKYDNADLPTRAFMMKYALTRLLGLIGAPERMQRDLSVLLDSFHDNPGHARSRLQRVRIENPTKTWTKVLELAQPYSDRQSKYDRALGDVIHNPRLVRHPPSTTS